MIKLNKKIVITILILFFLASVVYFITKGESKGLEYGILCYLLLFDKSKITKYDFIFLGVLVLGVVFNFVYIFDKNTYLNNFYSVVICGLSIYIYLRKSGMHHE